MEVMKALNGRSAQGHKLEINLIKFACMDKKLMKDNHWRTKMACSNEEGQAVKEDSHKSFKDVLIMPNKNRK